MAQSKAEPAISPTTHIPDETSNAERFGGAPGCAFGPLAARSGSLLVGGDVDRDPVGQDPYRSWASSGRRAGVVHCPRSFKMVLPGPAIEAAELCLPGKPRSSR